MKKKIIVFAPHPDDETFGCGGTIAKKVSEGHDVLIVVITDGRYAFLNVLGINSDPTPEQLKEIRKKEVKKAVNHLGVPERNLIFLNFVDGTLTNDKEKVKEKIVKILSNNNPDEVFFPYKTDSHPDHRATYRIVKNSIKESGTCPVEYQYEIIHKYARIGPLIEMFLNFLISKRVQIDISTFLHIKKRAIEEFKSQISIISSKQNRPIIEDIGIFLKNKECFFLKTRKSPNKSKNCLVW